MDILLVLFFRGGHLLFVLVHGKHTACLFKLAVQFLQFCVNEVGEFIIICVAAAVQLGLAGVCACTARLLIRSFAYLQNLLVLPVFVFMTLREIEHIFYDLQLHMKLPLVILRKMPVFTVELLLDHEPGVLILGLQLLDALQVLLVLLPLFKHLLSCFLALL